MIYYKFFIDSIKLFFKLKITGQWIIKILIHIKELL